MNIIDIIILGIVQGIAEFLPISSSAHLIIFREIFNVCKNMPESVEMVFDIALHFGTLLAIITYFFKDFLKMVLNGIFNYKEKKGKLFWYLVIATIPAAVCGFLFEDLIENSIRGNLIVIGISLIIMGVILYITDKIGSSKKSINDITLKDSIIIGIAQVGALIPGFSRSGSTISMSRFLGIDRKSSAKFSFFLSVPVVAGAVFLKVIKSENISVISSNLNIFIIGIIASFITGLLCIDFLLKYLNKHDFKIFMIYRILMALVIFIYLIFFK